MDLKVPEKPKLKCLGFTYKVIQYASNSNDENLKPKYLQNYDKRLDMGKHLFTLVITIKYCCPLISL